MKLVNSDVKSSFFLETTKEIFWNLSSEELVAKTVSSGQGRLTDKGALAINTGEFTGRSPKDRFIVKDMLTDDAVWWGNVNIPFSPEAFDKLWEKMKNYAAQKDWVS